MKAVTSRRRATLALVAAGTLAAGPAFSGPAVASAPASGLRVGGVERWDGADRYEASAAISARSYPVGVAVAFIASGLIYTDALSGAPVASKLGGPMLLVKPDAIPTAIDTELRRLAPKRIVLLGGPASVSADIESALAAYTSGEVERWLGRDRFEASAQISQSSFSTGVDTAYVSSGRVFADALSGAPVAGRAPGPMLLVDTAAIPMSIKEELDRLEPKRIIVLGGSRSVEDQVLTELTDYASTWVERWAGADRYAASATISAESFEPRVPVAFVAFGEVFSDALSGAPVAGKLGGPLLLVRGASIPPEIATELRRLEPKRIVVLGGTASVSTSVETELGNFVVP